MTADRLKDLILADLAENWKHRGRDDKPSSWIDLRWGLLDVRFMPVLLVRLAHVASRGGRLAKTCALGLSLTNRMLFGVECATQTDIGPGLYFPHTGGIVIGASALGARCIVYHQVTLGAQGIDMPFTRSLRPTVGDDVVLGAGAKVLGGVSVGRGAAVGANAVVTRDVAAGAVVGGVPAVPLNGRQP